jgi:hypothetical protein
MIPRSVYFGVRLWKLSNVGQSLDGRPKIYLFKLFRASEDTLNPWPRLHCAVVSTHQPALGPRGGLWPVLLMSNL